MDAALVLAVKDCGGAGSQIVLARKAEVFILAAVSPCYCISRFSCISLLSLMWMQKTFWF